MLSRLTAAALPPDGLFTMEFGLRFHGVNYESSSVLPLVEVKDLHLACEYGPWPWLNLRAGVPWRTWTGGFGSYPESGGGLGDASWRLTARLPGLPDLPGLGPLLGRAGGRLHWAVTGGTTLPTGDKSAGLTEGVVSSRAGVAATWSFWSDGDLPEMRLHLNLGYRWNGNERQGYGAGHVTGLQPWYPRYPALAGDQPHHQNDFLLAGAAVEFRQEKTALWIEYSEARLQWSDVVSAQEHQKLLAAGLRWGKVEGLAAHATYEVSLATDDDATAFFPAYPDISYRFALSYQLPLGGRDRDRDGIPDRRDHCPDRREDPDGHRDDDGCPDLDNDADGIPDALDAAPDAPEDFDGWADEDGMPDPDNDGDGIHDLLDRCPDEAEDFDGYRDGDGCPEEFRDSDGDGIIDAEDACRDTAEDLDGFEDHDGCPEPDNDLDGIDDVDDACPDQPETYNGIEDGDGCPD